MTARLLIVLALLAAPVWGQASRDFSGTAQYLDANDVLDLGAVSTPMTVMGWVRPDTLPAGFSPLVTKQSCASPFAGWGFDYTSEMRFAIIITNRLICSTPTSVVTTAAWQHLAVTYDGSVACSGVTFYRNGVAQTTQADTETLAGGTSDTAISLNIGGRHDNTSGLCPPADGKAAWATVVVGRALSAAEIQSAMHSPLIPASGLWPLWDAGDQGDIAGGATATNVSSTTSPDGPPVFLPGGSQ